MATFVNQLRLVLRRLGHAPVFTVITLITLGAAVGGNTLVFSVLDAVLVKPLPFPQADELVDVAEGAPGLNVKRLGAAPCTYFIYREQGQTFQDIGLYAHDSVSVTGLAEPEQVRALEVTDGLLPILGIPPILGRSFTREDGSPGAPNTVMLTYGYWSQKFAGDSSVIGRTLMVDGKSRQIIGVLPQHFHFLDAQDPALLLPFGLERAKTYLGNFSYNAIARLKPGVTLAQANADVARMLPIVMRSFPPPAGFSIKLFQDAQITPSVLPLKERVVGEAGNMLWLLMASIGTVLLIACANVANLLLVRVEGRRQELAVRSALGAGWFNIAWELLLESLILGLLSSMVGLGLAYAGLRVLVSLAPASLPRIGEIGLNGTVLLFTILVSVVASLLFGSISIFKYAGAHLSTGIREGGRALSQSREQHRARSVLVVVQVALALVLLISSGLLIRTFRALIQVNPGFQAPAELQTFRLSFPETQVPKEEQVVRMSQEILDKLAAIPGVSSAGFSSAIPMAGFGMIDPVFAADRTYAESEIPPLRHHRYTSPGFRSTLGTPLVAGRDLTWDDTYKKLPVALVSENMAREYWKNPADALGKRIRIASTDDWREIVGVAGNVYEDGVNQPAPTTVYWPVIMDHFEGEATMVRRDLVFALRSSRAGSESLLKEVRQAVWSINPNLPLAEVNTLDYFYRRSMARTSFTLIMLAVAGAMALLLGVVGIYGVIAYSVSQRRREIGIRMALGAQQPVVTGMFVRHGLLLTGIGVACGLAVAVAVMRLMSSLLFHVNPIDPITYAAVSVGLIATAFLASYLPSRRAASVDPVEALRAE